MMSTYRYTKRMPGLTANVVNCAIWRLRRSPDKMFFVVETFTLLCIGNSYFIPSEQLKYTGDVTDTCTCKPKLCLCSSTHIKIIIFLFSFLYFQVSLINTYILKHQGFNILHDPTHFSVYGQWSVYPVLTCDGKHAAQLAKLCLQQHNPT